MLKLIKSLLGIAPAPDYKQLAKQGALILDVRTKGEYAGGHIKGSVNIAVDALPKSIGKLKDKEQVIITCCASGMRSAAAKNILKSAGFQSVHNGGGWQSLQNKIR